MNVWVGPIDKPDDAQGPSPRTRCAGIRSYFWGAHQSAPASTFRTRAATENWHVYRVDLKSGADPGPSPPSKGVNAQIEGVSPKFPTEVLVGLNDRDPKYHDVHRVNLLSGPSASCSRKNDGFAGLRHRRRVPGPFRPQVHAGRRPAYPSSPDGKGGWVEFMKTPMADSLTTRPAGFDKSGDVLYLIDRPRARITGAPDHARSQDRQADGRRRGQARRPPAASSFIRPRRPSRPSRSPSRRTRWQFLDAGLKADFRGARQSGGRRNHPWPDRTQDDKTWIVRLRHGQRPRSATTPTIGPAKKSTLPVYQSQEPRRGCPCKRCTVPIVKSRANDFDPGLLPDAAAGQRRQGLGQAGCAGPDGAAGARRSLGPRRLGLQRLPSVPGQIAATRC